MLDRYHIGNHTRQSPEADVPLIEQIQIDDRLGGAGNVARNLLSLGLNPILIALVGKDQEGEMLQQLCASTLSQFELITSADRPTTLKSRIVDKEFKQYLRLDREITEDISATMVEQIIELIDSVIASQSIEALVIQDYNKGLLTPELIHYIQRIGKEKSIPIVVDPKKAHFKRLSDCTIFKPNLKELSLAAGYNIVPDEDSITLAIKELGLDKPDYIVVTMAEHGIYYHNSKTQHSGIIKGQTIQHPDVSGAGDTVLSTLVMTLLEGLSIDKMADLANQAGAAVCTKKGIDVVKRSELTY
jgi:rfaE bifunctional protein kinase chain/domain